MSVAVALPPPRTDWKASAGAWPSSMKDWSNLAKKKSEKMPTRIPTFCKWTMGLVCSTSTYKKRLYFTWSTKVSPASAKLPLFMTLSMSSMSSEER